MNKLSKNSLSRMLAMCRAVPNYKGLVACGTYDSARTTMHAAKEMLEADEMMNVVTGIVWFENGSTIRIEAPETRALAESFHVISVDELVDEWMVSHLKTRERL